MMIQGDVDFIIGTLFYSYPATVYDNNIIHV